MCSQQNVRCSSVSGVFLSLISTIKGWEPVGKNGWTCLACRDKKVHSKDNARRHEKTAKHVHSVQHHCANLQGAFNAEGSGSGGREGFPSTHVQSMHGIGLILEEMSTVVGEYSHTDDDGSIPYTADSSETNIQFEESFVEKTREQIAVTLPNLLDEDGLSDDEGTGEINVESEFEMEDAFGIEDTFAEVAGGMFLNPFPSKKINISFRRECWNEISGCSRRK